MRKSVSPSPGSEAPNQARVFGIPLEELQPAGLPGHQVPLLVQHIVDYIEEHGRLDLEGMFLVNGNAERVNWLRQRYDSGEEVDLEKEADLASAVSLLRLFLQELPEPIIPAALQTHILQRYQDYSSEEEQTRNMKYFLQQLPQVNYSLLRFLCRFLSSVASLQEESWSVGGIAAVFGPDIFHLDTEVEGHREQESVSRVLAELLENQEEFFDSEDDDVSTTNDYSSINEQITELLEDEKLEVCEDLPQDGEDAPRSDSPKDNPPSSSHISTTISILPGSADIIERTIRAAVEQHFFDLKTSIDHEISSYQENQEAGPSEKPVTGPVQGHGEEGKSDAEDPCSPDQETPQIDQLAECSQDTHKDSECHSAALEEGSGMDLDAEAAEALVDAENNINTARQDSQSCETMEQADIFTCGQGSCECDQNANSDTRPYRSCRRANSHAHQLHLNCAFPDSQWEDPVPSYQSWQDEGEGGEAQLSPLAGRMVPPPLEDDAPPLLARRFLDFHSQRFLQQDHDSPATTKTLPCGRPRRASFSSRDSVRADSVSHQLTRKLHNLKNKMKQFEEQFEKERNYKPSHADKAANPQVLKWMTDLTKIRKQIKDNKHKVEVELGPLTRPRSNTLPKSFGSTLEHAAAPSQEPPPAGGGGSGGGVRGQPRPTREETLGLIQSRMQGKREEDGWPLDVKKMTKEQLSCEKTVLQKNLLHYEGLHGRPATRQERLVVRPLYDRYRLVKQMLTRASIIPITVSPSSKRRSQILQPIIEGETSHFCDEIEEVEEEEGEELQSSGSQVVVSLNPLAPPTCQTEREGPIRSKMEEASGKLALDLRLSSSNASSMPDLLEQLWKTRADKKRLRKTIREFEDDFHQHNGRAVQKEDRVPMLEEYKEYKRIKAKLRLLEVLISKQDSSKSI